MSKLGISVMFMLVLISCGTRSLKPEAYIRWMEDEKNGLHKVKVIGDFMYEVQYQSSEYMMLKQGQRTVMRPDEANSHIWYFKMIIRPVDGEKNPLRYNISDASEYLMRQQYYSFSYKNNIQLVVGGHYYPCEYYILESNGSITPDLVMLVAFDTGTEVGDMQVQIQEQILGAGTLNFYFRQQDIDKIPTLINSTKSEVI